MAKLSYATICEQDRAAGVIHLETRIVEVPAQRLAVSCAAGGRVKQ